MSAPDTSGDSKETDLTSISNGMSSVSIGDDQSASAIEDLEGIEQLESESKARLLKDLFPSLSHYTVSHALKKHNDKWRPTLDDLLNQVYLSENDVHENGANASARGVDAFSEDNTARRGRKGKKRKNLRFSEDDEPPASGPSAPPVMNKWQTASADVDFIASKVNIPAKNVSSIYYQQNASMQRTIAAILKDWLELNQHIAAEDPMIQVDAYELSRDFPTMSDKYRIAIIGITQPSTAGAHELAKALMTKGTAQDSLSTQVIPQYAPLRLQDEDDSDMSFAVPQSTLSMDFSGASSKATSFETARYAALSQARAAYRKSKSDHLMGGAAAYYSQVGREARESALGYNAAAADSLVASQSNSTFIDLHGVTVGDALRITNMKVNQWWNGLGENRYNGRVGAGDRAQGFRIVTGAGKHSKGGKGVLGPAVKKLLENNGWRIESSTGEILVKGKVKAV